MARTRLLAFLAASLMPPGAALADSEAEPLKALEHQSTGTPKAANEFESLEGITTGIGFTTVAQRPSGVPTGAPGDHSELNYRGDVTVGVALDKFDDIEQQLFGHIRFGQGSGLNGLSTFSAPNTTAFAILSNGASDSTALIAEAWYQASIPLPRGSAAGSSHEKLEVNFGKMDPFAFFDQNAAANDETRQFLNSAFVHNPLLDAGGDIGADDYGFAPGLRLSYLNERSAPESWRLSLGIFGPGESANFTHSFSPPLAIVQAERELKLFEGLGGNYRAYYWRNGQAESYTGALQRHSGFGLSIDQRYGDAITFFGRYGHQITGDVRFDRALTLGAEIGGEYWNRSADAIGIALGALRTSSGFAAASATLDVDGDGLPDYGYAANRNEQIAELYYRYNVSKQLALSPSLQLIGSPGGDGSAATISVLGLRAQVTY
ncbi:MAG: carbohydrate porin [Burkholderiales bacterium]